MNNTENLLQRLSELIEHDESKRTELVPNKIRLVETVYEAIDYAISKHTAKVSYEIGDPYPSMAYISITGSGIVIVDTELFVAAVKLADNFEVYPLTDGDVQINLGFHNITRKAE